MQISDEIRGILDEGKKPASAMVGTFQEPVDEALDLLKTHTNLTTLLQKKLDALSSAFGAARREAASAGKKTGDDRKRVFEVFEGAPLSALRELREVIDKSIQHVENVCRRGRYQNTTPSYGGKWTATESLDEASDPFGGSSDLQSYGDFVSAMNRIEPGMAVNLGGTVFRVIGKSGNSAVVQPESVRQAKYRPGRDYPTPQSPVPSGTTTPQDTRTVAPHGNLSNPTGRTSLVGTSVLKYNPHKGQFQFCTGRMPGDYEMADSIQIVGHDPALPNIAGESIVPERLEMMLSEADGDDTIEKLRAVALGEEPMTVNDVLVDPFTAKAAVEMYDGLSEGNQGQMEAMSIHDILRVTYNVMERAEEVAEDDEPEEFDEYDDYGLDEGRGKTPATVAEFKREAEKMKAKGYKYKVEVKLKDRIDYLYAKTSSMAAQLSRENKGSIAMPIDAEPFSGKAR